MLLCLPFHAAEFIEVKDLAVFANAGLNVENLMRVAGEEIGDFDDKGKWNQKETANEADENVKETFHKMIHWTSHTLPLYNICPYYSIDCLKKQYLYANFVKKSRACYNRDIMASVFSKIVAGEIPCYKVYEDEKVLAFLDIHPESRGHVLVIPKTEVDRIYDLPDADYEALMRAVKKISRHMEDVLGQRTLWKVVGTDVPHAHVHLMPLDETWEHGRTLELSPEEFEEIRETIAF